MVKELKKAAKAADRIFLAPDPDREGEAIAWHIAEEIDAKREKCSRVLFNEITERAVKEAIAHPLELDRDKFEAQQARRVLDRLVGYQVSPILWEKVKYGLSAGRVQSVAVRLICDREREISAFVPKEYWSIIGEFNGGEPATDFIAKLAKKDGVKVELNNEGDAQSVLKALEGADYCVSSVETKAINRRPAAPFTTSKLQQEAARKLSFTAKKTMMIAQQLYEGVELGTEGPVGLISYMRTDSTRISAEAVAQARSFIETKYGKDYLPASVNVYKSKKAAQDAHEAIRPTYLHHPPDEVKAHLTKDQLKLYQLIWNRFIACQMSPAIIDQTRAEISAREYIFAATGSIVRFPGFMAVYVEGTDAIEADEDGKLPALKKGEAILLQALNPNQHFTQPPPRFTEASLVKELEENGIGRPSTYAAIITTIQDRSTSLRTRRS